MVKESMGGYRDRTPNRRLRDALAETKWTEQQLADAVNAVGAENGITLSYDRTAVAHWLAGTRPRPPAPKLIAEVISRRLGERVTSADLDLTPPIRLPRGRQRPGSVGREPAPAGWNEDVVTELVTLTGMQDTRRRLASVPYSLEALSVPDWTHAVAAVRHADTADLPSAPSAHAAAASAMARVFSADDDAFGGGHSRRALAAYLSAGLAPMLRAKARPVVRRQLLRAATELTYLCAFMCFDDELNGLSQCYYGATLRLAAENGDATGYAIALRAMSVQACALGHSRHAVQLAEAATVTAPRIEPARRAFLLGQLAVATAADRDRARAVSHLSAAERIMDRALSTAGMDDPVIGLYHYAALAHQQAIVRALLGDTAGAVNALNTSNQHRPASEYRSRALIWAQLAELQLRLGHLEEATVTWHRFLDVYPVLVSGRANTALKALRAQLRPYTRSPTAQAVLDRATTIGTRR